MASSSSKKKEEVLRMSHELRVRRSFSFDPVAVDTHLAGMNVFVDIALDDQDYIEEVKRICSKLGGTVHKKILTPKTSNKDKTSLVLWRAGLFQTVQQAREAGIPVVSENWLFDCVRKNAKLPLDAYLISDAQVERAQRREELGIKFKPKAKRRSLFTGGKSTKKPDASVSAADQEKQDRLKEEIRENISKGNITGTIKGFTEQLKDIIKDDVDLQEALLGKTDKEEDSIDRELRESLLREDQRNQSRQKKQTKRKLVKMNDESNSDHKSSKKIILPITCFFRSRQKNEGMIVVYQGNYAQLQELHKIKTAGSGLVNLICSDNFGLYGDQIDCMICLEGSNPSLCLLFALLKPVPIIREDFIAECIKANLFLSPPPITSQQLDHFEFSFTVFEKTSVFIFISEEKKKSEEFAVKLWTCRAAVSKFGGSLSSDVLRADVVVVLDGDSMDRGVKKQCESMSVRTVAEQWLLDSVFKKSKQPTSLYSTQ